MKVGKLVTVEREVFGMGKQKSDISRNLLIGWIYNHPGALLFLGEAEAPCIRLKHIAYCCGARCNPEQRC